MTKSSNDYLQRLNPRKYGGTNITDQASQLDALKINMSKTLIIVQ